MAQRRPRPAGAAFPVRAEEAPRRQTGSALRSFYGVEQAPDGLAGGALRGRFAARGLTGRRYGAPPYGNWSVLGCRSSSASTATPPKPTASAASHAFRPAGRAPLEIITCAGHISRNMFLTSNLGTDCARLPGWPLRGAARAKWNGDPTPPATPAGARPAASCARGRLRYRARRSGELSRPHPNVALLPSDPAPSWRPARRGAPRKC